MNRIKFSTVLAALSLLFALPAGALDDEEIWDMVKQAKEEEKYPDAGAVIIFDRYESYYKETGSGTTYNEMIILIRKDEAAVRYPSIHYDFNPRTSDTTIMEVKAYRSDGETVDESPPDRFRTLPAPTHSMFWNFIRRIAAVPRLHEGDALYYKVRRKGLNLTYLDEPEEQNEYIPPQEGHFFDTVYFEDRLPIVRKLYILHCPRSRPVQYKVLNGTVRPSVEFEPEGFLYKWEREDVPAFEGEPRGASFSESACKLVMASLENWEAKSRWAYEVNEPQFVISDEMQKKVDELIQDAETDYEKMFNLLHWVAEEVRYLGTDMGEGEGYTVHRTDEIFYERAGVCKDKAAVLVSMLRAAGFDAFFILTLAMEKAADVPADQFNHGVVGVRHKDGSWTYLDPTWAPKNRPLFNPLEQEQPILTATPEGEDLTHIPYSPPEDNPWNISAQTVISLHQPMHASLHFSGDGFPDGRMRSNIAYRLKEERPQYFGMLAQNISPFARVIDFDHGDFLDFNTMMTLELEIEADNYAIHLDDRIFFIPLLSKPIFNRAYESDYLFAADPEKRKYDLTVSCTRALHFQEKIKLPRGFEVEEVPEKIEMDGPAASLHYEVTQKGRNVSIDRKVTIKKRWIPPDEYGQFKEIVDKVKEISETYLSAVKGGSK